MSLEALKELHALDKEAQSLREQHDNLLLGMRRRYLTQVIECFATLTEIEGFKVKRVPTGASARLGESELVINCTDPTQTLMDAQAKYSVSCNLAPNRVYGILLCRQPLVEFTNDYADANDRLVNKRLEINYVKFLIENQDKDQWSIQGRLEGPADLRSANGQPLAYESFPNFDQAMKTALREISNAAIAPRS